MTGGVGNDTYTVDNLRRRGHRECRRGTDTVHINRSVDLNLASLY